MKWNFNIYFQQTILNLAKDGLQICPVQLRFQRGQGEITQQWRAGPGYE